MPPLEDGTVAPADANPGNSGLTQEPSPPDPGREPGASTEPANRSEADGGEPGQQQPRTDGEPATDPTAAQTEPKPSEPKPQRKSEFQRRIDRLARERDAARQQAEYYREQVEKSGQPKKLDPVNFDSDAEYHQALIEQTTRSAQTEFARSQAQTAQQRQAQIEQQIWDARVAEYSETVPDFEAVAFSASVSYGSQDALRMIQQMPEGPQVAYYLAKNQAEAQRFASMAPLETAFELGRIAQKLQGPPARKVSQAPNPVPTVRAKAAATGFRPDSNDPDGYRAWRDKLPD